MQRPWHSVTCGLAVTAALGAILTDAPGALAQPMAPPQAPLSGGSMVVQPPGPDESVRLFSGPKGEIFRLTETEGDQRAGGGSLVVSVPKQKESWETVLELRPKEPGGVSVRDGNIAVGSGGEVALAYRWWRFNPRSKEVRVARSSDGGKTWNQSSTQVDGSGTAFDPRIVWTRGKSLVVAWTDERRGRKLFDVYTRRSPDGGATWEPEQLLSRFARNGPSDLYARPELVSDGGDRVWAVWVGLRGSRSALYLSRSTDAGKTWTDPLLVSGESRSVFGQTLLRVGDRLLLVWNDTRAEPDRIFASSSDDAGVNWTAPVRVDHLPETGPAASSFTAVLNPDGEAVVAWQDGRNGREDIFLSRSTDGGRTWSSEDQRMDLDEPGTGISRLPRLARAPDGRIALAWEDDRTGFESIYLRVRSSGKKPEWGPEVLVAPATQKVAARVPMLAWGPGGLYVAWQTWDNTFAPSRVDKRSTARVLPLDGNK